MNIYTQKNYLFKAYVTQMSLNEIECENQTSYLQL